MIEFIVRLNDDGTVQWHALTLDGVDEHANAVKTVQAVFPGSAVLEDQAPTVEPVSTVQTLDDLIRGAETHAELAGLWRDHRDTWTADHNKLASERKKQIGKEK